MSIEEIERFIQRNDSNGVVVGFKESEKEDGGNWLGGCG